MLALLSAAAAATPKGITLDTQLLTMFVGLVIPLIVAFVTKAKASAPLKTAVNVVLAIIGGALAPVIAQGGHLVYKDFAYSIILAVLTAAAIHQGVYKPIGVTSAVNGATPNFGFGPADPVKAPPVASVDPSPAPQSSGGIVDPVPVDGGAQATVVADPALPDPPSADGPVPATPQGWVLVAIPKPSVMKVAAKKAA